MADPTADLSDLCKRMDDGLTMLVQERDFIEQPDARAFGGYVEAAALASWADLCDSWDVSPRDHPGRRTIYDASFEREGGVIGVDFRTKDLAGDRYSDGGICAVGNLLRWMVRDNATLLITEFGYAIEDGLAAFSYVATAPIHALPLDTYRIENLGTGQLRLNRTIADSMEDVEWERSTAAFFDAFAVLCVSHYERVRARAEERIAAIDAFVASGFAEIALK